MLFIIILILVIVAYLLAFILPHIVSQDLNTTIEKAIGYFGVLGLPTILFYWEWRREKKEQEDSKKKSINLSAKYKINCRLV